MRVVVSIISALFLAGMSAAQHTESNTADQALFRKDVNLVSVSFIVRDKHGAFVRNLTQDQFQVSEEGKPQEINHFSAENNLPLTLGILIDTSESMQRVVSREKIVAGDFLSQVVTDRDLAFVISFDVNADLLEDVTSDVSRLRQGLDRAAIHKPLPRRISGESSRVLPKGTLLYDAIYLGASEVLSKQAGRKAMLILTNGMDQGSQLRLRDALKAAQDADAVCYVLLIFDPLYGNDMDSMQQLTEQTGGRVISVIDPGKLPKAFAQISEELRSQYTIAYSPARGKHDGKFRRISIRSKNGYKVQARQGYYAPLE